MKSYKINMMKYRVLPKIVGKSQAAIAKEIGMRPTAFSTNLNSGDFKLSDAIKICNTYRIRLSSFLSVGNEERLNNYVIVPEDEWIPISFSASAILSRLNSGEVSYAHIVKTTELARRTIDTVLSGEAKMNRVLKFCNLMSYNLEDIVIGDPTLPRITPIGKELKRINAELLKMIQELRSEVEERQKVICQLRKQIVELTSNREERS